MLINMDRAPHVILFSLQFFYFKSKPCGHSKDIINEQANSSHSDPRLPVKCSSPFLYVFLFFCVLLSSLCDGTADAGFLLLLLLKKRLYSTTSCLCIVYLLSLCAQTVRERSGWASMCLKYVSVVHWSLKERGVCLAATPKDCHKAINTPHPHTQMMSAFIRSVVIRPLGACEAAAVPVFVSAPNDWDTDRESDEGCRSSISSPAFSHDAEKQL